MIWLLHYKVEVTTSSVFIPNQTDRGVEVKTHREGLAQIHLPGHRGRGKRIYAAPKTLMKMAT